MKPSWQSTLLSLILLLGILMPVHAQQERILNFDTQIKVMMDRTIEVKETITVYATGIRIKSGYIRSIPLKRDWHGTAEEMEITVLHVQKDGMAVKSRVKNYDTQLAIYTGEIGFPIMEGEHTYTFTYRVKYQARPFWKYDELTWNVMGHNINFPVEKTSCTVLLSQGKGLLNYWCHTGKHDPEGRDCGATIKEEGKSIRFESTGPLAPHQEFTIGMQLKKGVVGHGMLDFYKHGDIALYLLLGLSIMAVYAVLSWRMYGIDPPDTLPIFTTSPPGNYSPGVMGYLYYERFNKKNVVASLVNMAIKGVLRVEEVIIHGDLTPVKRYRLRNRYKGPADLPDEEKQLHRTFLNRKKSYFFSGKYSGVVVHALEKCEEIMREEHKDFVREGYNRGFLVPPILAALGLLGYALYDLVEQGAYYKFKELYTDWGFSLTAICLFVVSTIVGLFLYAWLIKRPSEEKLEERAEIKGLRAYMQMTIDDRTRRPQTPEQTVAHFEELLPYAIALDVEKHWIESFKEILEREGYAPDWVNEEASVLNPRFYTRFAKTIDAGLVQPTGSGDDNGMSVDAMIW